MQDISRSLRNHSRTPWLIVLLLILVGILLPTSVSSALNWLNSGVDQPKAAAILPGMTLEAAKNGLVVTSVRTHSQAAAQGVTVGDTVIAIDGKSILTLDQARRYLKKARGSSEKNGAPTVHLRLAHDRTARDVPLGLKGA